MDTNFRQIIQDGGTGKTLAGIHAVDTALIDANLDQIITKLQRRGLNIAGCRQRVVADPSGGCGVRLQSIASGKYHRVTQDLGVGSISCNVDVEAMEQLALKLMQEINLNTDLVVVNRYGKREAEGAGFRCVFERAVELGVPVLTVVNEQWLEQWRDYGGEWASVLSAEAIEPWCNALAVNRNPLLVTA